MTRLLIQIALCLHLLAPMLAHAQAAVAVRDPLNYPLRQWALVLGLALFGGFADWWGKVRKGEVAYYNIAALVGQLTISAFAGVITFFICDYLNFGPLLTPAIVGIAGHMGGRGIALLERFGERRVMKALSTGPMPLDEPTK